MKTKKIVMWVSVACFGLAAILALSIYFSENLKFTGSIAKIMFTLLTVGIATFMSINGLNLYERKKNPLSIVSLSLIGVSALMALYLCWFKLSWNTFTKFVILISVTSILFNFVVTGIVNLKKEKLIFQIFVYLNLFIFDFYILSFLFGIKAVTQTAGVIFVINIIVSIFSSVILSVFSRKNYGYVDSNAQKTNNLDDGYIRIKKEEYDYLKARIAELEAKLNNEE